MTSRHRVKESITIRLVNLLGFNLCSLVIFARRLPSHPPKARLVDQLFERQLLLAKIRTESESVSPRAAPVPPRPVTLLDEVERNRAAVYVVISVLLHRLTKTIRFREEVVQVAHEHTSNNLNLLIGRYGSMPGVIVDDNTTDVVPTWIGRSQERDTQSGRELGLFRADVMSWIPGATKPRIRIGHFYLSDNMSTCQRTSE
jgi:hypothetical protein